MRHGRRVRGLDHRRENNGAGEGTIEGGQPRSMGPSEPGLTRSAAGRIVRKGLSMGGRTELRTRADIVKAPAMLYMRWWIDAQAEQLGRTKRTPPGGAPGNGAPPVIGLPGEPSVNFETSFTSPSWALGHDGNRHGWKGDNKPGSQQHRVPRVQVASNGDRTNGHCWPAR